MSVVLCIETATRLCSVAVGRDGVLLAERGLETDKHIHAESVSVFVDEVMREAGLAMREIDAVAVGIGPGSYTGLRIGLSAAKGLCFALGKPIIGIGTLETLVHAADRPSMNTWPMVDARRMEVFTQPFDSSSAAMAPVRAVPLDDAWAGAAGACAVFGDGADKADGIWKPHAAIVHLTDIRPHARAMLGVAAARLRSGATDDLAYLVPLYGKEANVTQPRKRTATK